MTPGEYYHREKARRLARAPRRLYWSSGEDIGVIRIPSRAVLAAMLAPTLTETVAARTDVERRRRRARALGVRV